MQTKIVCLFSLYRHENEVSEVYNVFPKTTECTFNSELHKKNPIFFRKLLKKKSGKSDFCFFAKCLKKWLFKDFCRIKKVNSTLSCE